MSARDGAGGVAVVIGAGGGIGGAMVRRLAASGAYRTVYAAARRPLSALPESVIALRCDLTDEASLAAAADAVAGPVDLVVVASGILHDRAQAIAPEKSWRAIDAAAMARVMAVNAIGPALVAKHFLPLLPRDRRAVFAALSARVGSIGDNRLGGWHAYRASKAALNMLIANFAIELARTHPLAVVAALHPGTVGTDLSAPFRQGVAPDRLFTADLSASHLLAVIDHLGPADSGGLFAWDGARLPW